MNCFNLLRTLENTQEPVIMWNLTFDPTTGESYSTPMVLDYEELCRLIFRGEGGNLTTFPLPGEPWIKLTNEHTTGVINDGPAGKSID